LAAGEVPAPGKTIEPEQTGERRLTIRRPGTPAYWKAAYHARALGDPGFFPLLVLDAALTGAKGLNLWSSFRVPPPQRSARLYLALVETGLAASVSGSLLPTGEPFLYNVSATATEGTTLATVESAMLAALDEVRRGGITEGELSKAKAQLKARLVFDNDSVTNIAHQLGYFETVAGAELVDALPSRIAEVSIEQVAAVAVSTLVDSNRTIGWFEPTAV